MSSLATADELEQTIAALTARIAELDTEIARDPDSEWRSKVQDKRDGLAHDRERAMGELAVMRAKGGGTSDIERRLSALEDVVAWLVGRIDPTARQMVARLVFWALLVMGWSMWMVKEARDWLLSHPAQAIVITLAVIVAALIVRWLPEDGNVKR